MWLDYFRPRLTASGELERLIKQDGVSGVSFDVDLFVDLVSSRSDYSDQLAGLLATLPDARAIVDELIAVDVRRVCQTLQPLHERSAGEEGWVAVDAPGYVGLELPAVVAWWEWLTEAVGAANVMLKLPASAEGLLAAERIIASGGSVYLAHVFSTQQVEGVLGAFLRGLELLRAAGGRLSDVRVAAGVNLVRIDVAVDELLRRGSVDRPGERDVLEPLIGRAAIAVARRAWGTVQEVTTSTRWRELAGGGAQVLRLAWEGLRTGDPARREVEYLEELVGPDTIAVASRSVLAAFRRQGKVAARLAGGDDEALEVLADLSEAAIDLDQLAHQLQSARIQRATERMEALFNRIEAWRETGRQPAWEKVTYRLGPLTGPVEANLALLDGAFVRRLWDADPSLWASDPEQQSAVRNRLGWLYLHQTMQEEALPVLGHRGPGERSAVPVVMLGMGGSSLGAETCRLAYEVSDFTLLDTTVPRAVAAVAARVQIDKTAFIVASKSGTTVETLALADYFFARADAELEEPGARFLAITDPGTPLPEKGRKLGYARVWLNPADVGGRYSVLSYFGLVPMVLMGIDLDALLDRASRFAALCAPEVEIQDNPAVMLGAMLAAAATSGRDKITFLTNQRLSGFADWAEQLIAESLGKEGGGLVPVSGEPIGDIDCYSDDRFFVQLRFTTDDVDPRLQDPLEQLAERGHPCLKIELGDPHDLGREFLRWELATAVAGALLGVNPFDEPDVLEAKERTVELLESFERDGRLPELTPVFETPSVALFVAGEMAEDLGHPDTLAGWVGKYLLLAKPPDYVAIQAFLTPEIDTWHALQGLRALIRDSLGVATTVGWGPRFLHSTGQLHKGGPATGVFLQLSASETGELQVPGRPYSFGVLVRAQGLGDLMALQARSRRVMRVHLRGEVDAALATLLEAIGTGLAQKETKV